jgi:hypothetical protein
MLQDSRPTAPESARDAAANRQQWHDYQDEIKTYRDKRAAHHASSLDPDLPPDFPRFDVALKAARFYYDWILKRMQGRGEAHQLHFLGTTTACACSWGGCSICF